MDESLWLINLLVLSLIGSLLIISVISFIIFVAKQRPQKPQNPTSRQHSFFLHFIIREWWSYQSEPIVRRLIVSGCHPNLLTYLSLVASVISGTLFAFDITSLAGIFVFLSGAFDSLDGRVARGSTFASNRGAFLDSSLDRFGEIAIFTGLAILFQQSWIYLVIILGLSGSLMVSYARARGQSLGVDFSGGLMQRPERIVYLGLGSVFDQPFRLLLDHMGYVSHPILLEIVIVLVSFLAVVTAVYRIACIAKRL